MNFSDVIGGIADITDIASGIVGIGVGWSEFVATVGGLSTTLLAIPVPVAAVIAGLGLVVGALALFGDGESEAEKQTRLFNEAQVESEVLKGFVSNLRGLADENGYVKNFEQAQYYVDQINSAMPGTVKLTEDGKLTWLENAEAIDENIKQLERKAKV